MHTSNSEADLVRHAKQAHLRDWSIAAQLSSELRERFPNNQAGYQTGAAAALALGQFDEAKAILTEAAQRFEDQTWVASDRAWLAHACGDADQARQLAADLRSRFPEQSAGYQIGGAAARTLQRLDEASAILTGAELRFPNEAWVATDRAWLAYVQGDGDQARQLAADLRSRFPEQSAGYQIGGAAARTLQQFDEASAILTEAELRFPNEAWVATDRAWLAYVQGDGDQARQFAEDLRSRFPEQSAGYQIGGAAARTLQRFDEASAILIEAERRFPNQAWTATDRAWLAYVRGDADQARQLAADLRSRFPEQGEGYQIGAAVARTQQQFEEESAILSVAAQRFSNQAWVTADQASLARTRGDVDQALQLAAALRSRHPADPRGYQIGINMLRIRNRLGEARAVLEDAIQRFSSDAWFTRQLTEITNLEANRVETAQLIAALSAEKGDFSSLPRNRAREAGKLVVIVGMHRAGTSLCAKVISRLGFELGGPLMTPNSANPDGYQEHREITEGHEALLSLLGATWDTSWAVRGSVEERLQSTEARSILDRLKSIVVRELRSSGGRWAFKDPRTACFLPAWMNIFDSLGIEPLWVLAVRDPRAVAASLYARNQLPIELGQLLWAEHYLNALRHVGPQIACIVHYENWFSSGSAQLNNISSICGITSAHAIEHASLSIQPELIHNADLQNQAMINIAKEVYSWLNMENVHLLYLKKKANSLWNQLHALSKAHYWR